MLVTVTVVDSVDDAEQVVDLLARRGIRACEARGDVVGVDVPVGCVGVRVLVTDVDVPAATAVLDEHVSACWSSSRRGWLRRIVES